MLPGTAPHNTFKLPPSMDISKVEHVLVIYEQNGVEVFRKDTFTPLIEDNAVDVKLTQDETLKLDHKVNLKIQLWLKFEGNDDPLGSNVITVDVDECLRNGVM